MILEKKREICQFSNTSQEVVAIIPARGGSKGIPRKNIVPLAGKPLIAYTIEVALRSRLITRVIVSTDDKEIAEVAKGYGAEVPFFRPRELANDEASLNDAINYTLNQLEDNGGSHCDVLAIMLATHPFRSVNLVDHLLRTLLSGYSMIFTVKKIEVSPTRFFTYSSNNRTIPVCTSENQQGTYFRKYGTFTAYNRTSSPHKDGIYLHHLNNPIELIDLDTIDDLHIAEKVIQHNMFDFGLQ